MRKLFKRTTVVFLAMSVSLLALPHRGSCEEGPKQEGVHVFTLKDIIELAIKNNKDIQKQKQQVEFARANIMAAQSKFFPQGSIGYTFTYNGAVMLGSSTLSSLMSSKKDIGIFTGFPSDNYANLSGSQMIYDGGASIANLKQSRVNLKMQEETLRASILNIEYQAKSLYYNMLYSYETLRIAKYILDQAQMHYENVKSKFDQGTASKFDVLQSRTQMSLDIPPVVNAENSIESVGANLKKLLYLNIQDEVKVVGELSFFPIQTNMQDFLSEAYKSNPLIKQKIFGIDYAKWAIEYAKSGWYPNINANTNYYYRSGNMDNWFNYKHYNWNIGIGGTLAFFDGMNTLALVKEQQAKYEQAIIDRQNTVEQVTNDIKQACLNMKTSASIVIAEKDNLEYAKETLRLSYVRFDNGVGINLDVIDAMTSVGQVEQNIASGMYNYLTARSSLEQALGREYMETEKENSEDNNGKKK